MKYKFLLSLFLISFSLLFLLNISSVGALTHTTGCGESIDIGYLADSPCCAWETRCTGEGEDRVCWEVCVRSCSQYNCSGNWTEFKASTTGCNPNILKRQCHSFCGPAHDCCSCGRCQIECSPWEGTLYKDCHYWQRAERAGCLVTKWGLNKPQCKCYGPCLQVPQSPRYFNNPNFPTDPENPEETLLNTNLLLPVKLDWDNVLSWDPDNIKDGASSYIIRIENTTQNRFTKTLAKSEFNPAKNHTCLLKSGASHNWGTRACCNPNGTNCGPESNWKFETNLTPELLLPADPDWSGPKYAEEVKALPTTIRWCNTITPDEWPEDYKHLLPEEKEFPVTIWRLRPFLIKDGQEKCHPYLGEKNGICWSKIINLLDGNFDSENLTFTLEEEGVLFTKLANYKWQITPCWDRRITVPVPRIGGVICGDFGQKWSFETKDVPLPEFGLISPTNDLQGNNPLELPVWLRWSTPSGINSFIVYLDNHRIDSPMLNYPQLSLDTIYSWKVRPCWDFEAKQCKGDAYLAGPWYFKTTGAPPKLIFPKGEDIPIPIIFNWQDVGGAKSYVFNLFRDGELLKRETITDSQISIDHPLLVQKTNYSWKVKTCARRDGTVCGEWSALQSFKTFRLSPPQGLVPEHNSYVYIARIGFRFKWDEVAYARYYKYEIIFKNDIIKQGITPYTSVSVFLVYLGELGKYTLRVRACLDEECNQSGPIAESIFTLKERVPERIGAFPPLVPCGLDFDFYNTPWNEREACQIKHFPIILQNIINFFLWRLIPILLVLLTLATGAIFYFSIGGKETIPFIRRIWRAFGIGLGIIFFAWIIVSFFLNLLGYQVGVFGVWYKITN